MREGLADLQRIEAALTAMVARCVGGRGRVACPLIAALQQAA